MLFVFGKRAKQASILNFILLCLLYYDNLLNKLLDKGTLIVAFVSVDFFQHVQMRLNKVSELIHNSTNHQNLDSAGVSVHFQEIIDMVFEYIQNFHFRLRCCVQNFTTIASYCRMMGHMKLFQEVIL